jgi:hypothetical protein|tara:strand:+ start:4256 stop:4552 length:297 start_codon:yes stop_codon:yes gene_type:complete
MLDSPDAVMLYIPLMKHLGMSWGEIKNTPRLELMGLISAYREYAVMHSMDGYSDKQVSEMSKSKPEVRSQYVKYLETRRRYEDMVGKKRPPVSFRGLV